MKAKAKPCPARSHPERSTIDRALQLGQAPRSVRRRHAGLNRKVLTRHRDECLEVWKGEGVHSKCPNVPE